MKKAYTLLPDSWAARLMLGLLISVSFYSTLLAKVSPKTTANPQLLAVTTTLPIMSRPVFFNDYVNKSSRVNYNDYSNYNNYNKDDVYKHIVELSRSDHITLLKWSLQNYRKNVQDYSVTFHKQERIRGKLKPRQKISVWFKERPFSLLMKWRKNAGAVDKLLYVKGSNDDKMIVHPTGIFSWVKSVRREPRCEDARRASLKTCDQFGFNNIIRNLLEVYDKAQRQNDLQMNFLGESYVHGRRCISMERLLPSRKDYPNARLVMDFDTEVLLPISMTSYDWQGKLISRYVFEDLKFNNGLSAANFTPRANKL